MGLNIQDLLGGKVVREHGEKAIRLQYSPEPEERDEEGGVEASQTTLQTEKGSAKR